MRLSDKEVATLKSALFTLSPTAKIYLFGSRVDDGLFKPVFHRLIMQKAQEL